MIYRNQTRRSRAVPYQIKAVVASVAVGVVVFGGREPVAGIITVDGAIPVRLAPAGATYGNMTCPEGESKTKCVLIGGPPAASPDSPAASRRGRLGFEATCRPIWPGVHRSGARWTPGVDATSRLL
jgi:hypothetical protein